MGSPSDESFSLLYKQLFPYNLTLNLTDLLFSYGIEPNKNLTEFEIVFQLLDTLRGNGTRRDKTLRTVSIISAYSLVVFISIIGNLLVSFVIFFRQSMRSTTNIFIANLASSDLLMTLLIPINCARFLMDNWIFGETLCILLPFFQVTSVHVSTFTMTFIACDRHQAIINPLKPRMGDKIPRSIIIILIWAISGLFSLPYAVFQEVKHGTRFRPLIRCQTNYPQPTDIYRKSINIFTFVTQYLLPLLITITVYVKISYHIWYKSQTVGELTETQKSRSFIAKRRTIKMLFLVVVVFTVCWLPLNVYHLLVDLNQIRPSFNTLIACHWIAMTSVCYNPFLYFWLNSIFREIIQNRVLFCCRKRSFRGKGDRKASRSEDNSISEKSTRIRSRANYSNGTRSEGLETSL